MWTDSLQLLPTCVKVVGSASPSQAIQVLLVHLTIRVIQLKMPKINYICAQGDCVEHLWVADGLARQTSATSASPQSWHDPDCTMLFLRYNYGKHAFHFHYL